MAPWVRALATWTDDLSLRHRIHMMGEEKWLLQTVFSMCAWYLPLIKRKKRKEEEEGGREGGKKKGERERERERERTNKPQLWNALLYRAILLAKLLQFSTVQVGFLDKDHHSWVCWPFLLEGRDRAGWVIEPSPEHPFTPTHPSTQQIVCNSTFVARGHRIFGRNKRI